MNGSSKVRRILSMHPAHRSVGVLGRGMSYCPSRTARPAAPRAIRVRFALGSDGPGESAALASLWAIASRRRCFECERMDMSTQSRRAVFSRFYADADCTVLFFRGLFVFDRDAVFDVEELVNRPDVIFAAPAETAVTPVASGHPLLDRVGAFVAGPIPRRFRGLPGNSTRILSGRTGGEAFPAAWARNAPGRLFRSLLGSSAEDFQNPDFLQLALNAIKWAGN